MKKFFKDLFFLIIYYLTAVIRKRSKNVPQKNIDKILVISWHLIGDSFLSLPVIVSLKKYFNNVNLSVVCKPVAKEIFENVNEVDNIISIPNNFFGNINELKKLRDKYTLTIDLTNDLPSAFFSMLSDGKYKIAGSGIYSVLGINYKGFPLIYDSVLPPPGDEYVKTYLYKIILQCFPDLKFDDKWKFKSNGINTNNQKKNEDKIYIGFGIGGSKNEKLWELINWVLLADKLKEKRNINIFLFGNTSEIKLAEEIIKQSNNNVISLVGKTALLEAIHEITKMDYFISNDTGLMHIAIHYNIPTICISGPTNHLNYIPQNNQLVETVRKGIFCKPCYYFLNLAENTTHHDCKYNVPLCQKLVTVNDVLSAFERIESVILKK